MEPLPPAAATPGLRVLFIGNSHTYMNNMPHSIQQLAAAAGQAPSEPALAVAGDAKLADRLGDSKLRERSSGEHWDYVVLQEQQPAHLVYALSRAGVLRAVTSISS